MTTDKSWNAHCIRQQEPQVHQSGGNQKDIDISLHMPALRTCTGATALWFQSAMCIYIEGETYSFDAMRSWIWVHSVPNLSINLKRDIDGPMHVVDGQEQRRRMPRTVVKRRGVLHPPEKTMTISISLSNPLQIHWRWGSVPSSNHHVWGWRIPWGECSDTLMLWKKKHNIHQFCILWRMVVWANLSWSMTTQIDAKSCLNKRRHPPNHQRTSHLWLYPDRWLRMIELEDTYQVDGDDEW